MMSMRNRKITDIGVIMLVTSLALVLVLTVVMAANPLLASQSTNATNSTVSVNATSVSNVTMTNVTTCPPGLLTAVQANLYIDDMWLMRVGANMSGFNTTSFVIVNATGLNETTINGTFTGFNITKFNMTAFNITGFNLTPATLQNITNYYISKGECLLALQFLVHLRHYLVHVYVLEKHAEILNRTLTYRLMLLNGTLTRLEQQGLLNSTQASQIYSLLSQLKEAIVSGNYSEAMALLSEYKSLLSNISSQYYEEQKIGFANRINHELEHYVMQIIGKSITLNGTLSQLAMLDHELGMLTNVTGLNITSVKELHELFKELKMMYPLIQGNETAQQQLLQLLKHGKGFNDWLNVTQQFGQEAKGWQLHGQGHGKGQHGQGNGGQHGQQGQGNGGRGQGSG
ncbi:hypothetical protein VMUT_1286 [Vulcanisaeta moutnovskia 768-28]|uniref:Uncharacterized protein n=2 Tax=Vulcanisaeta TaxID=164450 RepID=F0QYQ8_VULM7|nr:hypothetical protein VMUT_1286 [Vulcanisaeta moutnovskia 768-28]